MKNVVNNIVLNIKNKYDKIKLILFRVLDIFLEHPIRYIFFLILLIVLIIIMSLLLILNLQSQFINISYTTENEQFILIKGITLQNWQLLLSGIVIILSAIWAMYQFDKSTKSKQQEKANCIAKEFSDKLILNITVIDKILTQYYEMDYILTQLFTFNCTNFNFYEMNDVFTKDETLHYLEYIDSSETDKKYQEYIQNNYTNEVVQKLPKKFKLLMVQTLNSLETLCMNISSNAAGSQYIYNSLHTVFFNLIQESYILISSYNKTNVDLLYSNIINVYKLWQQRRQKDINIFKKTERKIEKLKIAYKKNMQKLLSKKIHRV